jgi:hypothetical protein
MRSCSGVSATGSTSTASRRGRRNPEPDIEARQKAQGRELGASDGPNATPHLIGAAQHERDMGVARVVARHADREIGERPRRSDPGKKKPRCMRGEASFQREERVGGNPQHRLRAHGSLRCTTTKKKAPPIRGGGARFPEDNEGRLRPSRKPHLTQPFRDRYPVAN